MRKGLYFLLLIGICGFVSSVSAKVTAPGEAGSVYSNAEEPEDPLEIESERRAAERAAREAEQAAKEAEAKALEAQDQEEEKWLSNKEKRLMQRRSEIEKERAEEISRFKKKAIENTRRREKKY